jgi:hypothetical protein
VNLAAFDFTAGCFLLERSETTWNRRQDPPSNCYGATRGRVLKLMGNSQGRDNVKKRARRRKKMERLALAKRKQKAAK